MKKLFALLLLLAVASYAAAGGPPPFAIPGSSDATKIQGRNIDSTAPTDAYVLTWDEASLTWKPAAAPGAGTGAPTDAEYVTFGNNTILTGDRVLTEGTGIDLSTAVAGQLGIGVNTTEIGTTTWGAGGANYVWTFNTTGTDPVLTVSDSSFNVSAGVLKQGGTKVVLGTTTPTDNTIPRWDGTGGQQLQNSSVAIDDLNNLTGIAAITTSGAINKVTLTAPATGSTLTIADGLTLSVSTGSVTLAGDAGGSSVTLPASGTLATTAATQPVDATLTALAGLETADVSIIEMTGTDAFGKVTSGGNNYILGSNSDNSALEFKTPANVLSQIGAQPLDGDLTAIAALSVARGSLITGQGGTPAWAALTIGTSGYYLRSDGTDAAWAAIAAGDLPSNSDSSAGVVASGSGQNSKVWKTDASGVPGWRDDATGGSPTFDLVAAGTNTTAAMVLGAGSSLAVTGGTFKIVETGGSPTYHATIQGGDQADNITITLPGATSTLVGEGVATGGLLLGDSTPDTAGEIGYASNNLSFHDGTAPRTVAALEKAQTFTANNVFGDADTDTLTLRSLLVGGNSRAVWIAGSAPTPSYATGTNELYVGGDIESGGTVYASSFVSTGTGDSYVGFGNNSSGRSPTAGAYEMYVDTGVFKLNQNGTEYTVPIATTDYTLSITTTGNTTVTLPTSGTLATLGGEETFSGAKTFSANVLLNSTHQLQFGDSGTYINQPVDGTLGINGDTIVQITAPNIKLAYDAAAYLNVATADGGATTISAVSDGADTINIGDNSDDQVRIRSTLNATNGTWSGHTLYFAQCAASMGFGQPAYIQSTGKPGLADADAAATMPAIGLVVVASTDADTPCTILTHGVITNTDWNWTPGKAIYVADGDAGAITATLDDISDTDDVVQVVGIAIHADSIFVNPSLTTITLE